MFVKFFKQMDASLVYEIQGCESSDNPSVRRNAQEVGGEQEAHTILTFCLGLVAMSWTLILTLAGCCELRIGREHT